MEIEDHIEHWTNQAENDLKVAQSMLKEGHYLWSLFLFQ